MPVNNVYSNATFSCLPGQGVCETASAYYARIGGLKFSAAISTETLAWSDNEDTMRNEVRVLSYCIGAKLPPAECESHNVVMFPQQRFPAQLFSAHAQPEQTWRESIAPPEVHHYKVQECGSKPKSSFQRFWQGLLQSILPCVKFQK
ncbi:hypothetical protein [Enterobacter hormaechei]|uniref:hypothetical protein n=1 Tax=Enterobacter hormaechei TaxID=158836 RepID=UPI000F87A61A|nr:hypothetical protein [Enterobacter hormaechei]MBF9761918.1 hypothetical protein [Enterobacter hormaechei]MBF9766114.1 hypothetical protein [Enterobacter hormaechei]MCM7726732.1 hypothetical protein [Enterobacter hormaechei]MRN73008.1 hypothetical protein [Enterobacter hormaechei]RTP05745.1 hypothetical protein EKN57_04190 [Enterobacter hormaechei]